MQRKVDRPTTGSCSECGQDVNAPVGVVKQQIPGPVHDRTLGQFPVTQPQLHARCGAPCNGHLFGRRRRGYERARLRVELVPLGNTHKVSCCAHRVRQREVNLLTLLHERCDACEHCGVVDCDRLIVHWVGILSLTCNIIVTATAPNEAQLTG